ncbi:myelin protein zero-like protein 2 isoform X2 [Bubalus kerabau]|uniref:myelin protein zero-like protein 2 isoform X2 n=1 Tax=Bubalus carabanensis TaxID=3119969 RepID=UPI00244E90D2|nr:myelin protein zero-like protein 2 isoform X2 [Bubalus carabanensis]XP_055404226.1 myelin protein zero-like protein 2 isoform X2 [Bubalus carabanensis]
MYGKSPTRAVLFLLGLQLTALWPIAAVEIYTPRVLEAVNGTDVRLKCTFSSFAPVGDALTVTWNFRPRDGGPEQFVFYYHVDPFKPMSGRFKDRVAWDGNPERYDVSILLWKLQFDDNGTYTCQKRRRKAQPGKKGFCFFRIHRLTFLHVVTCLPTSAAVYNHLDQQRSSGASIGPFLSKYHQTHKQLCY